MVISHKSGIRRYLKTDQMYTAALEAFQVLIPINTGAKTNTKTLLKSIKRKK